MVPSLESLVRASWQGALLIAAVWLLCRFARRLSPAVRSLLWWGASLKLLVGLAGLPALPLPLLPPAASAPVAATTVRATGGPAVARAATIPAVRPSVPPAAPFRFPWQAALLGTWGLGLAWHTGRAARELARLRALCRRAAPVEDPAIQALFARLTAQLGLRRSPRLLASGEIASPQVIGLWTPAVLLPENALPPADLEMALCHELVHLCRRDLWLGWVPAVAERLFFFHPLAALAAREYSLAREAACDARVLDVLGTAPQAYGRLLLKLGIAPRPAAAWAAAGASPSFITLKRRLEMLQQTSETPRRRRIWPWLAAPVALLALAPLQIVRADDPKSLCGDCVAKLSEGFRDGIHGIDAAKEAAPMVPATFAALGSPYASRNVRLASFDSDSHRASGRGDRLQDDEDSTYVLTRGSNSTTMRGNHEDLSAARKLRREWGTDVLIFRRDGKLYAVRDAATLAQANSFFAPQEALGNQQAALGEKQAALGEKQAKLGDQQSALGEKLDRLSRRHDDDDAVEDGVRGGVKDGVKGGIEGSEADLERQQEELGQKQEELGAQQEELGRQQEKLGEQQEKLAAEAEQKLESLIDQAMRSGLAQEVKL